MDFLNDLRELRNRMAKLSGAHLGPGGQYEQCYEAGAKAAAEVLDRYIFQLSQNTNDAERAALDGISLMIQRNAWRIALVGLCDKETYSPLEAAQFVRTRIKANSRGVDADNDLLLIRNLAYSLKDWCDSVGGEDAKQDAPLLREAATRLHDNTLRA